LSPSFAPSFAPFFDLCEPEALEDLFLGSVRRIIEITNRVIITTT
jgi:hypothetical protein